MFSDSNLSAATMIQGSTQLTRSEGACALADLSDAQLFLDIKVLLIEDDRVTRRIVSRAIGDFCDLVEASCAGQGASKFMRFEPDLVFLDLDLPDNNGHNVLDWLLWNDPEACVVVFSGHCDARNVRKAMNAGAKGFVPKPFDRNLMIHHIYRCADAH